MTIGLVLLALHEMQGMQVFVQTAAGKTITLDVERCDTIKRVKAKIADQEGCGMDTRRLVYANTILEEERCVSDYKIERQSTLQLLG